MNEKPTKRLKHYLSSAFYWHNKKEFLSEKILELRSQAEKDTSTIQDVPVFGGFLDHRQDIMHATSENHHHPVPVTQYLHWK